MSDRDRDEFAEVRDRIEAERLERVQEGMDPEDFITQTDEDLARVMKSHDALAARMRELGAEVPEWTCESCRTVYPGPPQPSHWCIVCPKCGGTTRPDSQSTRLAKQECAHLHDQLTASQAEVERLKQKTKQLEQWRDGLPELVRDMRGIRGRTCKPCNGFGVRVYGSTATWHGGIGGQAITSDVCDKCWGSGDSDRPWKSWRAALREEEPPR